MIKLKSRISAMCITFILVVTLLPMTAFAGGGEQVPPTPVTPPIVTEPKPPEDFKPLTPEGDLSLVDDVTVTDEMNKQFITAVSKNGNYFYLVIDRAGDTDNVYLLNMVDEADLLALMEEPPVEPSVCICEDKCEIGAVNANCTICATDRTDCTGKAKPTEPTEPQTNESSKSPTALLALIGILALVGGGAAYYFKVVKNKTKTKGNPNINEYDLSDNDENNDYGYNPTEDSEEEMQ